MVLLQVNGVDVGPLPFERDVPDLCLRHAKNPGRKPATTQKAASVKAKSKQALSAEDQRFYNLGFRTLPNREGVTGVTNELVNRIPEQEGI